MRRGHTGSTLAIGLLGAWLAALLAACSSGGHGGSTPPPPPPPAATVISGQVIDAAVTGATVTAYAVSATGVVNNACIQVSGACATATTDASGNYSLNLGSYSGPVLLQSSGGSYTDTVTGQMVTIPAGQTLSVFLPSVAPGSSTITAQLTAMTTIEAQFALQAMSQGVTAATAASTADTTVQTYFGLAQSVVTTGLLDLTQANCGTAANDQAQLDASLILAGFSELASQFNVQPIALAQAIGEDATSNGGQLTGTVGGATPITVPLASGSGTVPLATIEGSSFGQTLKSAIATFMSSVRNACNASESTNQSSALGSDTQNMGGQPPTYLYTLNGTVAGFTGTSTAQLRFEVVLNCSADTVTALAATATVNGNGAFSAVVRGSINPTVPLDYTNSCNHNTWTLSVSSSPGQTCGISPATNGTFTATNSGNTNVATPNPTITCSALPPQLYNVGGQLSGLAAGHSVTLADTDSGATLALTTNGAFTLDTQLANGTPYNVTANNSCTVTNGSGTINGANVNNVAVSCGSGLSTAIANPQGLLYLPGTPAYLFVANAGNASGGEVLVYSEQTSGTAFSGLTLVASITAGVDHPTRLALDKSNHLYVTNAANNTVTVYDVSNPANIAANTIPQLTVATITSTNITNPLGLTVDGSGNVYVASNGVAGGWVSVFVPCASTTCTTGSFVFSATLTNDNAGHQFAAPGVMADYNGSGVGGGDFILLGLGPSAPASNEVLLYNAPLTANSVPIYVLTNAACPTGPSGPTGLALTVTVQPEVYISSYYNSSVQGYGFDNFLRNGQACPVPDFSSSATSTIAQPEGLAVDGFGTIFVANASASTVTVYSPGSGLAAAPVYTQH